jgi:hypothetical protein
MREGKSGTKLMKSRPGGGERSQSNDIPCPGG